MRHPNTLLGLPFRLGANPDSHNATDCLGLARAVLAWHGISLPIAERQWYRRLRRNDYSVFEEELNAWGKPTTKAVDGVIGLDVGLNCPYALVVFYENGWLHFNQEKLAAWVPLTALTPIALYYPQKSKSAMHLI